MGFEEIPGWLEDRRRDNLYRRRRVVDSPQGPELLVSGKRLLNFCSNDYLGLANDPRVRDLSVTPHDLAPYDQLTNPEEKENNEHEHHEEDGDGRNAR